MCDQLQTNRPVKSLLWELAANRLPKKSSTTSTSLAATLLTPRTTTRKSNLSNGSENG